MKAEWHVAFRERARRYWTEARTRQLNGDKNLPLLPGEAPILLRAMGLLKADGSLPPSRVRKYRQINHMVLMMQPALTRLCAEFEPVRVLDAGCGRSYLTMLLAWWFSDHQRHPAEILGVDRSVEMVETCRRRAELADLVGLSFQASPLAELTLDRPPHAVLSLHACDTATDDAIVLGVASGARFIALAPCCQGELSKKWEALEGGDFAPVQTIPHFRRTAAATLTDVMRVLLLRAAGYEADAMEFVDGNHTAKNTLLRAVWSGTPDVSAAAQYDALVSMTGGAGIQLAERLRSLERHPR
jgi:SAM-dependent methyltransferase